MSKKAFLFGLAVIAVLIVSLYRAKYGASEARAEIEAVETQIADAEHRKALLEAELSHMIRREWIEEYARRELGMGPPSAQQFIRPEDLDARVGPVLEEEAGQ
ncbi:MAG: septum formation initiator family protein [Hyphomonadaceae bacterium]|nr:septum formation initiator family protein [Hyphomonadaceae bacterium]